MARADLLISLVRAGVHGDDTLFKRAVDAIIAEERAKQHNVLADQLAAQLRSNGNGTGPKPRLGDSLLPAEPRRLLDDLVLGSELVTACRELVEEHHRQDLLRSYNLEPRHRVLLAGPPGNGKTSLAEALATELMVPFYTVRYEALIGSYLGETAARLRRMFDEVRTRRCLLFFDEFDTLGKERGDEHETGEIKRVVSSLLLQIDALPSHVVVVTATNHPELLDRAVWRRFQLRLALPAPTREQRIAWFEGFQNRTEIKLGLAPRTLANHFDGASFSELEEFGLDVFRRYVLALPDSDVKTIVKDRLSQWKNRFVLEP